MLRILLLAIFLAGQAFQVRCISIAKDVDSAGLSFVILGDWGGLPSPIYTTELQKAVASSMGKTAADINAQFAVALGKLTFHNKPFVGRE